jgi:hypothetical protein
MYTSLSNQIFYMQGSVMSSKKILNNSLLQDYSDSELFLQLHIF